MTQGSNKKPGTEANGARGLIGGQVTKDESVTVGDSDNVRAYTLANRAIDAARTALEVMK